MCTPRNTMGNFNNLSLKGGRLLIDPPETIGGPNCSHPLCEKIKVRRGKNQRRFWNRTKFETGQVIWFPRIWQFPRQSGVITIIQWKLQNPVWVLQAFFGRNLQFTGFCSAVLMTAYQITDFQSAVICSLPVFAVPEFEVSTVHSKVTWSWRF